MSTRTDIDTLVQRLNHSDASVRRVAAIDLARSGEPGLRALVDHLPRETDEKAAVLIVQRLGDAGFGPGLAALAVLRDGPATSIRVHHAAILAHDRIERAVAKA